MLKPATDHPQTFQRVVPVADLPGFCAELHGHFGSYIRGWCNILCLHRFTIIDGGALRLNRLRLRRDLLCGGLYRSRQQDQQLCQTRKVRCLVIQRFTRMALQPLSGLCGLAKGVQRQCAARFQIGQLLAYRFRCQRIRRA